MLCNFHCRNDFSPIFAFDDLINFGTIHDFANKRFLHDFGQNKLCSVSGILGFKDKDKSHASKSCLSHYN